MFINSSNLAHLPPVIRPAAEFHLAVLVVEREPGDVDLAGGLEDAGGDVGAAPLTCQHHVRGVRSVEGLVRTDKPKKVEMVEGRYLCVLRSFSYTGFRTPKNINVKVSLYSFGGI